MSSIQIKPATNVCSLNGYYGILEKTSDGDQCFTRYGRDIQLKNVFRNKDDGRYYVLLSFEKNEGDREEIFVERAQLDRPAFFEQLLSLGADIVPKYRKELQAHLQAQFEALRSSHGVHEKLGWCTVDENIEFRTWKSTGKKSRYLGVWDVEPAGKFSIWKAMVQDDVLPYDNLTIALLIGLSDPISALITNSFHTQNPIYSISGNSSSGKTTAGILVASTTFNPRPGTYDGRNFLGLPSRLT